MSDTVQELIDHVMKQEKAILVLQKQIARYEDYGKATMLAFSGLALLLDLKGVSKRDETAMAFQALIDGLDDSQFSDETRRFLENMRKGLFMPLGPRGGKSH